MDIIEGKLASRMLKAVKTTISQLKYSVAELATNAQINWTNAENGHRTNKDGFHFARFLGNDDERHHSDKSSYQYRVNKPWHVRSLAKPAVLKQSDRQRKKASG